MYSKNDFKVGQEVIFVPNDTRECEYTLKVEKIGKQRIWFGKDQATFIGWSSAANVDNDYFTRRGYQGKYYLKNSDREDKKILDMKITNILNEIANGTINSLELAEKIELLIKNK